MVAAIMRACAVVVSVFVLAIGGMRVAQAQVPVTTWHYDNLHSGANVSETILTPENVNWQSFGKIFTQNVDGAIVGQALYMPSVTIPSAGVHNVIYVATMNDSVYAFDADSASGANASPLWHTTFLVNGAVPVTIAQQGCGATTQWTQIGVVSTPVIDATTGTLFVVAKTYENSSYVHRLHALDITTGLEKSGSPIVISASYLGNVFADMMQVNRPALTLANGIIYIPFGSNGCRGDYEEGWVMAYNETTLQPAGAWDDEPGQSAAAVWMRGAGLSVDSEGYIYGATADGPFTEGTNFGQSVFKLVQSGSTLELKDWFTPYNEAYLDYHDLDMSEPVLVLPNQAGKYRHLAAAVGKEGTIYILNRDSMGHFCSTCTDKDTQIVQELPAFAPQTGALVFWNNTIYTSGDAAPISALPLSKGVLGTTPIAESVKVAAGHSPVISADGTTNGVLWQMNGTGLAAYNATTLKSIYRSAQAPGNRDVVPTAPHFANLMVVNGKLYIGTNNSLVAYGLLK